MEEIKKEDFAFALEHRQHKWDAHLSHDQSIDQPLLLLYPNKIPFDDLVSVDQKLILYRNGMKNKFKGELKKTSYKMIHGVQPVDVDCQYDD